MQQHMLLTEKLNEWKILLASKSPRRQMLLKDLGINFTVISKDVPEDFPAAMDSPYEVAEFLANKKAIAFKEELDKKTILITADTIVFVDGMILNKPDNYQEAYRMLEMLSGKKHEVITGVCLKTREKSMVFHEVTEVYFKKLTAEEISFYLKMYQPYDKAGAYGVQEWIGLIGLERINGSYHNVIGLPIQTLYKKLEEITCS